MTSRATPGSALYNALATLYYPDAVYKKYRELHSGIRTQFSNLAEAMHYTLVAQKSQKFLLNRACEIFENKAIICAGPISPILKATIIP